MKVRFAPILFQKSFWGDERKLLEPMMRFTRGDVRDYIVSSKIDHGYRRGAKERRRRREAQRSTFARFFGLFDFRLLEQYRPEPNVRAKSFFDLTRTFGAQFSCKPVHKLRHPATALQFDARFSAARSHRAKLRGWI
jgi:hypothetical protein